MKIILRNFNGFFQVDYHTRFVRLLWMVSIPYVTDVMPTLLEFAGVDYPTVFNGRTIEPMTGRSMINLLDGSKESIYSSDEFVGGEMRGGKWMRQGNLKAVMVLKPYGTGVWKLFNVAKDPGEAIDLPEQKQDKLKSLVAAWDQYAKDVGVVLPA